MKYNMNVNSRGNEVIRIEGKFEAEMKDATFLEIVVVTISLLHVYLCEKVNPTSIYLSNVISVIN